jgi:protein O-mannosyl-transferase
VTPGRLAGAALLAAVVCVAYAPVRHAGYVWDDDAHVTHNAALVDARGLAAIWTTLDATPQYYPLTHTTFWIEHHLWGLNPLGYHVDNVLLHAASAFVLWRLLLLLEIPGALLAACVFAVHPVEVESVAWITERKNVLSGLLYLLSAHAFLSWGLIRGARRAARPWVAALLFVGALLAKTVVSTLPVALAIVLWWKRGRVRAAEIAWLAPMLAVGAAFGALTRHLEATQISASGAEWALGFSDRLVLAGRVPWFYLGKLAWPADLSFVYPRWAVTAAAPAAWIPLACGVALAAAAWRARGYLGRGPIAALAFTVVTLAPALGFFNVYPMRYSYVADHFQYLASLGPIVLAAAAAATAWRRLKAHRPWAARAGPVVAAVLVGALAVVSFDRAQAFADEETLWRDTLARNPAAWLAHNDLGILLARRGDTHEAESHFRAALALKPDHAGAAANLGYALEIEGRDGEAADALSRAAELAPDDADARIHLTRCLLRLGRADAALPHALAAARLRPDDPEVLCDAGTLLAQVGRPAEGLPYLDKALALRPNFSRAEANREMARRRLAGRSPGKDGVSSDARSTNPPEESH